MSDRILWLNTQSTLQKETTSCLEAASYEVVSVTSPDEVLTRLRSENYRIFLAPLQWQGKSCLPLIEEVNQAAPSTICMITLDGDEQAATATSSSTGSCLFLVNSTDPVQLLATVAKALNKSSEQEPAPPQDELQQMRKELLRTRDHLNILLDSTMDAVFTLGTTLAITYANRGANGMLGYSFEEFESMYFEGLLRGAEEESTALFASLEKGAIQNHETELRHKDGRWIPVIMSLSKAYDHLGHFMSLLAICKNITKQKQLENELKEKIVTDSLTGLYNQRYFYDRLEREIERARRQNHSLSLLLFDVDNFKNYNDTHGHLEGDRLLRTIGEVVRLCTRDYVDVGCRYGGDEFTVILPETDLIHAKNIAERIRSSFENHAFDECTLSIGLMTYNKKTPDREASAESFIRYADEMMYNAKRSGGNRVHIFDADGNHRFPES